MSGNCYYCGGHPDEVLDLRERHRELEAENTKLRSQLQDRTAAWVTLEQYSREVEENEKLREQLVSVKEHVGWLKQYHLGTTEDNWRDMKLRAECQLVELSTLLSDD